MVDYISTGKSAAGLASGGLIGRGVAPTAGVTPTLTQDQMDALALRTFNTVNPNMNTGRTRGEMITGTIFGTAVNLADNMWASPLNPLGLVTENKTGDVWALADDSDRQFYRENKDLIDGTSGIAGTILSLTLGDKLVTKAASGALAASTIIGGSRMYQAGRAWEAGQKLKVLTGLKEGIAARQSVTLLNNSNGAKLLVGKIAQQTGYAIKQEALVYGVMWENDAVNQEGWQDDAFWIGIGMGFGAAAGAVQARGILRKLANSEEAMATAAAQLPMAGRSDLMTSPLGDAASYQSVVPSGKVLEDSTNLTQMLIASRAQSLHGVEATSKQANAETMLRAQAEKAADDSMRVWAAKGIEHLPETRVGDVTKAPEFKYIMKDVAKNDPWMFHGAAAIGQAPADVPSALLRRTTAIKEELERLQPMLKGKNASEARQRAAHLARAQKQEAVVIVNGAYMAPDSAAVKAASGFDQTRARRLIKRDEQGTIVRTTLPTKGDVIIDHNFTMRAAHQKPSELGRAAGRKIEWETLPDTDRLYAQEAVVDFIKMATRVDSPIKFKISDSSKMTWWEMDVADEIIARGGKVEFADKTGKIQDVNSLRRTSLQIKAQKALAEAGEAGDISTELRLKYNLPMPTSMERLDDAAGNRFRVWLKGAATDQGTMGELIRALDLNKVVDGLDILPPDMGATRRLNGEMFSWNRDKDGNFLKPTLVMFNPKNQIKEITRKSIDEAKSAQIAERMGILTDRTKASFVHNLARSLVESPELNMARKVSSLITEQVTGLGNALSQMAGEFLPKRFLHRDNPILLAASRLLENVTRAADMDFRQMMETTGLQKVLTAMDTPGKAALAAQLDEFASLRPGWDLAKPIEVEPGWWAFQLENTDVNKALLGVDKIENGDFMMNLRIGKPIMLSTEAMEALVGYGKVTSKLLDGSNTIRKAKGRTPTNAKSFFMPTQDTKGKLVGFVFDENNRPVKMNTVVASTQAEYDALVERTLADLPNGYRIQERTLLEETRDIWDLEAMKWIDHGRSSATAGIGRQSGGLTGAFVRKGAFKEALEWARNQRISQARETLEAVMEEPLRLAKMRAVAEKGETVAGRPTNRSIFDEYVQALTGNSARYRDSQMLSGAVRKTEAVLDKALAAQAISTPARHIMDIAHRFGIDPRTLSQKRTYDEIVKTMGDKSPFADQMDFIESQGVRVPPTMRGIASSLNAMATNIVLRWDPTMAHATMNMLGLIPTLFSGIAAGGAPSTINLAVKGRNVPMLDTMKIMRDSIGDMFRMTPKAKDDYAYMVAHGDAAQSSYEYAQTLDAMSSHAGFMGVAKKIDKVVSFGSDKSENLSRTMAHFTGLRVADYQGIKGKAARHTFAREFANAAIADYTPTNRPELYQTALGSVFGLFQSYVVSQYTKMFHWLEDGNYRAMGIQAAFQASLFGAQGTYGIGSLFNLNHAMLGETGEPSLVDVAYQRFGPALGGALMHGGFGELTEIALWTRGDINLRVPALSGQLPPGPDVMVRLTKMMYGTVSEALNQGPIDAMPAIIEHVQREMPNRVLKGIMAVTLLDGKETDKFGQIMTDTRTWVDSIIRVAGVRSTRMQQELEVFYANKSDLDRDAARRDSLRMRVRTDIRAAERNGTTIDMMSYFDDYVGSGGNPRMFRSFVKDSLEDAVTTRSAQQLKKSLDTRRNALHLWRYGAYGAWGIDDGTTPIKP